MYLTSLKPFIFHAVQGFQKVSGWLVGSRAKQDPILNLGFWLGLAAYVWHCHGAKALYVYIDVIVIGVWFALRKACDRVGSRRSLWHMSKRGAHNVVWGMSSHSQFVIMAFCSPGNVLFLLLFWPVPAVGQPKEEQPTDGICSCPSSSLVCLHCMKAPCGTNIVLQAMAFKYGSRFPIKQRLHQKFDPSGYDMNSTCRCSLLACLSVCSCCLPRVFCPIVCHTHTLFCLSSCLSICPCVRLSFCQPVSVRSICLLCLLCLSSCLSVCLSLRPYLFPCLALLPTSMLVIVAQMPSVQEKSSWCRAVQFADE